MGHAGKEAGREEAAEANVKEVAEGERRAPDQPPNYGMAARVLAFTLGALGLV